MENKKDTKQDNKLDIKQDSVSDTKKDTIPPFNGGTGKIDPNYQDAKGRFKKGVSVNPGGRPKSSGFQKLLKKVFGEDSEELVYLLLAQMQGIDVGIDDKRMAEIVPSHLKKYFKKSNKSKNPIDKKLQSDNVKWLIERMQGKVLQENKNHTTIKTNEDTKWKLEITHVNKKEDK